MILPPLLAAFWLTLPCGGTAWDLLETTVPFAIAERMDTGGVHEGLPARIGADGSSWTTTAYRLGEIDVTDLVHGGTPLVLPDLSFVRQIDVNPASASVSENAPGPSISIVSLVGAARWDATATIRGAPSAWQSDGPASPPPTARLVWLARSEGTAGGPLGSRGRAAFAAAVTRSAHLERDSSSELPGNRASLFGRAAEPAGANATLDLSGWYQRTHTPFAGRARLEDRAGTSAQRYAGVTGAWKHAGGSAIDVHAMVGGVAIDPDGDPLTAGGTVDRVADGSVETLGALTTESHRRSSVAAALTPRAVGRHQWQLGADASHTTMDARPFGARMIGETIDGLPARAWEYGYISESRRTSTAVAAYASDAIVAGREWTIDAGVRMEHASGSAAGSASAISWTSIEPRISAIFARGGWRVTVTGRRCHPPLLLDWLAFGDPAGPAGNVFLWTDANGDGRVEPAELGALVARVGPGGAERGFSSIDPGLRRPATDEADIAVQRQIGSRWLLWVDGVSRRTRELPTVLNVGVPASAYDVTYVFDPGLDLLGSQDDQQLPIYSRPAATFGADRYLLTNGTARWAADALHLGVSGTLAGRWSILAGATAMRSRGPAADRGFQPDANDPLVPGDPDPNAATFADGRLFFDRAYAIKIAGSYHAPGDVDLGAVARYADGQPFARLVLAPDLPQGPDVVRAFANGLTRFTFTFTLDGHVGKTIRWRSHRLTAALDAFNLLNTRNEVEEDPVAGPRWRAATGVQPPRVIQISLRVAFR